MTNYLGTLNKWAALEYDSELPAGSSLPSIKIIGIYDSYDEAHQAVLDADRAHFGFEEGSEENWQEHLKVNCPMWNGNEYGDYTGMMTWQLQQV